MSEPETDWTTVPAERFKHLTPHHRVRWLNAVTDVGQFDAAIMVCVSYDDAKAKKQVEDAKAGFILNREGLQAEYRHGEEMTAAAVANQIGLKALRRSNLSLIFSVVAIAVTIGISIWQHYSK